MYTDDAPSGDDYRMNVFFIEFTDGSKCVRLMLMDCAGK